MHIYIRSEPGLFTVGHYSPNGQWHTDSDHETSKAAAERCRYLNGGPMPSTATQLCALADVCEVILANALLSPDALMDGTTDCYVLPLDDITSLRDVLASCRDELTRLGFYSSAQAE